MSGDFDASGSDSMNYMAMAGVRWKQSETFQWIFGAFYSTGFDDDVFLPAVGFMWEPSDQMDLVLPDRLFATATVCLILLTGFRASSPATVGKQRDNMSEVMTLSLR